MKNDRVPELRFPEFTEEWVEKKLLEVANITTGSTPSTSVKEYYSGEYLFVSPADLNNGRYVKETKTTLTEKGFKKGRKISKNAILFVSIGSTIGKVGQAANECITNQQINSLEAKKQFSNDFIYNILAKNGKKIKLLAGVQALPQLNKTDFSNLRFNFPTLPEQTKRANFLTAVDKRIDLLQKKKAQLAQYKKGVMQKLFSQTIRFKKDDGSDFPDWVEKKLGEVCDVIVGGTPSTTKKEYWGGNIGWIGSGELKNNHIKQPTKYITELGLKYSSTYLMPKNTVVLAMTGATLGKIGYLDLECAGNQSVAGFLLSNEYSSLYLYYILQNETNQILSYAGGAAQAGINKKNIEELKVLFPCIEEQQKIANFLSSIDKFIEKLDEQIEALQEWKKGLLQKMFV